MHLWCLSGIFSSFQFQKTMNPNDSLMRKVGWLMGRKRKILHSWQLIWSCYVRESGIGGCRKVITCKWQGNEDLSTLSYDSLIGWFYYIMALWSGVNYHQELSVRWNAWIHPWLSLIGIEGLIKNLREHQQRHFLEKSSCHGQIQMKHKGCDNDMFDCFYVFFREFVSHICLDEGSIYAWRSLVQFGGGVG